MKRMTLVTQFLAKLCWVMAGVLVATAPLAHAGALGSVIPLPGHISEIVLDEPRSSLYAANFTAGQIDVISTTSNRLVSSIKVGGQPSGLAMSPDGRYLVVTNYNNFPGSTVNSVAVINLNDLSRQDFAITSPPLAVAFGADGTALVITTLDLQKFRPAGGTFELVTTIASLGQALPVPAPTFPREITTASMSASGDGNYIFGVTDSFVFSYQVPAPAAVLSVRLRTTFLKDVTPPVVSAAFDGSSFMVGQYLLDRRLRAMAEHPDIVTTTPFAGGQAIDFGARVIYASYLEGETVTIQGGPPVLNCPIVGATPDCTITPGTTTVTNLLPPKLFLQDTDNLTVRDRLQLPERIIGRIALAGGGRFLYAVGESGILYLPISDLVSLPQIRPSVENVFVQFDFCQRSPLRYQFRIENPGAGSADFEITTNLLGVSFNPSRGTAPTTVEMVVDFAQYSRTQGTTHGQITITSRNAVNVLNPLSLDINVKDQDQRGRILPLGGQLVDILADPRRDQFYVLEQTKNELHVFNNSDLSRIATYRTGNRPNWMTLSADRRYLLIANSAGENLTVINLDTRQNEGYLFMLPGHQPMSVAADNGSVLVASRVRSGAQIDAVNLTTRTAFRMDRLGVFQNSVSPNTAMIPTTNLSGILIAESDGGVKLWDAANQDVILARKDLSALKGNIAAGPNVFVVDNNILNTSLVVQSQFTDTPNQTAGLVFVGDAAVRTSAPRLTGVDTGVVQRFDVRTPTVKLAPVRMAESPRNPTTFPFLRTLASLRNGTIVSTSTSGLVELPSNFDAGIAIPRVSAITNAADFGESVGAGSLVSIFGQNLAPGTASAGSLPLPTTLADTCVTINGLRLPLLYASPTQINAQMPFELAGQVSAVLHTPGGLSDIFYADVLTAAPAIFRIGVSGQSGTFPAVIRTRNNQLTTLSNPLHPNEVFTIFATGLGDVGPAVEAGMPGPASPLATTLNPPSVLFGDTPAPLLFAGLAPGFVGLYQINAMVPSEAPRGTQIPLTIVAGGSTTTVNVRVVE